MHTKFRDFKNHGLSLPKSILAPAQISVTFQNWKGGSCGLRMFSSRRAKFWVLVKHPSFFRNFVCYQRKSVTIRIPWYTYHAMILNLWTHFFPSSAKKGIKDTAPSTSIRFWTAGKLKHCPQRLRWHRPKLRRPSNIKHTVIVPQSRSLDKVNTPFVKVWTHNPTSDKYASHIKSWFFQASSRDSGYLDWDSESRHRSGSFTAFNTPAFAPLVQVNWENTNTQYLVFDNHEKRVCYPRLNL